MDFQLSDEQQLMIASVKEYCEQYFSEEQVREYYARHDIPIEATKAWVDAGFGLLGIPEEQGGIPSDKLTIGLVLEAAYRYSAATVPFINNSVAMFDIVEFGNEDQVKMSVDAYHNTGRPPFSLGISEPEAGSDNMNMSTVSVKQPDGTYRINGSKTFVTQGDVFPYVLVLAKDEDPSRENANISMWLVPKETEGISWAPLHKIGQEILSFGELYFDDVTVTEDMRVGEAGKAFVNLMHGLEMERAFVACWSLGLAQAAMDDAAAYASQRVTFGQTIGKYQLVQERLCNMETKLQAVRTWTYRTLWEMDHGISVRTSSALLKRYAVTSCFEVVDDAMQIMGGLGYTTETRVSRIWRDCRGNRFGGGADDIMVHIAGRQLVKSYAR